ncbi:MAG TPA: hypothetical protein VIO14_00925 [Dehalococcoidia bacterium]
MFEMLLLSELAEAREVDRDLARARAGMLHPAAGAGVRVRLGRLLVRAGLRLDPAAGAALAPSPRLNRG